MWETLPIRQWEIEVSDSTRPIDCRGSGRDGGSRTRNATGYEPVPGTARIAAMTPR